MYDSQFRPMSGKDWRRAVLFEDIIDDRYTVPFSLKLDRDLSRKIKQASRKARISKSALLRHILRSYFKAAEEAK